MPPQMWDSEKVPTVRHFAGSGLELRTSTKSQIQNHSTTKTAMKLFLLASALASAAAYTTGPGSCPSGMAAVGQTHLREGATSSTLDEAGYTLGLPATVQQGTPFNLSLNAAEGSFIGYLIRVEGVDAELTTSDDVSGPATACTDNPSMAHTNSLPRGGVSIDVDPLTAGTMVMDVTVVEGNSETSTYRYQRYMVDVDPLTTGESPPATTTVSPADTSGGAGFGTFAAVALSVLVAVAF